MSTGHRATPTDRVGASLREIGISPTEVDSNSEPANVVDGLYRIGRAIDRLAAAADRIADALTPTQTEEGNTDEH